MDGMVKMGEIVEHASVSSTTPRIKLSKRVKARNRQILSHPCSCKPKASCHSRTSRRDEGNGPICSIPSHAVFVFLDPLLLGVIQVEYESKSLSEAHPVKFWIFITAICFYSAVLGVKESTHIYSSGNYDHILSNILMVLGALSSTSLLSILLPRFLVWILILIWASPPLILQRHLLKLLFHRIWGGILNSLSPAACNNSDNMLSGMNQSEEQHLPK